jgi:uroporphyrin-III C-methyltransferase/precorrin-2 dehydrogenase/sirohydrochlorin ferrochelatase
MPVVSRQPSDQGPARIQPLSVLPVFLNLSGKRVVVAGGSDAAAWKAELLAQAGADVHVYARPQDQSDEMTRIVAPGLSITLHEQVWDRACLVDAAVAVADTADEKEALAFEAAARSAGAACNVIDKPAFCHFQFGSIVNRSPVVVGISTSGAAPILGQAVRRRIETLLPPSLADWAVLARRLRDRVLGGLEAGAGRRAFWEKLVDRAFGPGPIGSPEELAGKFLAAAGSIRQGHVTFVGAGPGDAEYLTLKAVRALQAADVIL